MSSDDGYVLRVNEAGKYVLHSYCASAVNYPPIDDAYAQVFDTLEEAIMKYNEIDGAGAVYRSEYGLTTILPTNLTKKESDSKMTLSTEQFARKPFFVDAVQVTAENIFQVAEWANGEVRDDNPGVADTAQYVHIRVARPLNERQTKAYIGDWVLYAGTGYKVYTNKAFMSSFERRGDASATVVHNVFNNRDAGSGQFVSDEYAKAHPETTVQEKNVFETEQPS